MGTQNAAAPGGAIELTVTGMTCEGCVRTVTRVLSRVPGVTAAHVELDTGRATVQGVVRPEELKAAVEAAGFGATPAGG